VRTEQLSSWPSAGGGGCGGIGGWPVDESSSRVLRDCAINMLPTYALILDKFVCGRRFIRNFRGGGCVVGSLMMMHLGGIAGGRIKKF
jgi:hypothetical protein